MPSANPVILPKRLADGYFTGTYKCLLVTSVPSEANLDAFTVRSDIVNEVANGNGYTTGGKAVTCTVGAVDTANNRVAVTFGSPAPWTAANFSAVGAWIYKEIGAAATDQLVSFIDFGGTRTASGGDFTVTISTPLYINA